MLPRLTSLRWYAALVVFLYHFYLVTSWAPLRVFSFGQAGVSFFFLLSGFVLAWSTATEMPARTFYRRRFARIYPAYVVMLSVGFLVLLATPGNLTASLAPLIVAMFIVQAVMVQAWVPSRGLVGSLSFNPPQWSLSVEAFFYGAFPLLNRRLRALRPRHRDTLAAELVVLAALASAGLSARGLGNIAFTDPLIRLAEFVLGITLAIKVEEGWRPRLLPVWSAALLTSAACLLAHLTTSGTSPGFPFPLEDYIVLGPACALLVAAAVADLDGRSGLLTRPFSQYLGQLSFTFYLVHYLILLAFMHLGVSMPKGGLLASSFVAALAGAVVLHHVVELPCQRALRGSRRRASAPASPVVVRGANRT